MTNNKAVVTAKVVKVGNSFGFRIPKALVDTKVLKENHFYDIQIVEQDALFGFESRASMGET